MTANAFRLAAPPPQVKGGRKLDLHAARSEPSPFAFDVLHLDGTDLVDQPYLERMRALDSIVPEAARVPRLLIESAEEAEAF